MKLNYLFPSVLLSLCSTAQAAVMSLSGTLVPSVNDPTAGAGVISGTFDDTSNVLNITVTFTLDTAVGGSAPLSTTIPQAVSVRIGGTMSDPATTNSAFTSVQVSSDSSSSGATQLGEEPHIMNGNFILTNSEETNLTNGELFAVVDGSDLDLTGAIVASPIPEPSAILLSLVSLGFLTRRNRC